MSWQDWVGTASYTLLAFSYLVTNIYWLRLLAIVALTIEAVYFYVAGDQLIWVGILWAAVFNAINIVQLIILTRTRFKLRMSEEEKHLHASAFGKLEKVEFGRLLAAGRFEEIANGQHLTRQDEPVKSVHLLLRGGARVVVDGEVVARIRPGDFIGEMGFIGACNASATVIAEGAGRSFRIGVDDLRALTGSQEKIEAAMNARFSIDLARKLRTRPLMAKAGFRDRAAPAIADKQPVEISLHAQTEPEFAPGPALVPSPSVSPLSHRSL
jgi:CRP-like cAMP-binding protein